MVAFCGFFESGVARRFSVPSVPVAGNIHDSRVEFSEVVSYTNCGLHTADFAAILLLQNL